MEQRWRNSPNDDTGREPLLIRFLAKSGDDGKPETLYDEVAVDHVADMALIFYAAGGAALGAVLGACAAMWLCQTQASFSSIYVVLPICGFVGAMIGALGVMLLLNIRGLIRWDGYLVKRTYKLKSMHSDLPA